MHNRLLGKVVLKDKSLTVGNEEEGFIRPKLPDLHRNYFSWVKWWQDTNCPID